MTRRRLDLELVRRGLVATHGEARDAIAAGKVTVGGLPATNAGTQVSPDDPIQVEGATRPYVSRGGEKLAGVLDEFGIDPSGRRCVDLGASTGGFTDVLLSRGAEHVVAVDVGYGQLAWRLRNDPRVTVMERTNARSLSPEDLSYRPDLVTADLSFISLTKVVPAIGSLVAPSADVVLLVKPQFEAGRSDTPGGVVRESAVRAKVLGAVMEACGDVGLGPVNVMESPLRGPAGNVEVFLHTREGVPRAKPWSDRVAFRLPDGGKAS